MYYNNIKRDILLLILLCKEEKLLGGGVKMISFKLSHLVKVLLIMVTTDLIRVYFSPDYTYDKIILDISYTLVFFIKLVILWAGIRIYQMAEKAGGAK